jgi:hypothetical protein
MLVSFLLTMLSVAHIFEIPFMVLDPQAFQKSNQVPVLKNFFLRHDAVAK